MLRRSFRFALVALVVAGLVPVLAQTKVVSPTFPRAAATAQTSPVYFPERFDWQHKRPDESA